MSGVNSERAVPSHSDNFKNQLFVVEVSALYTAFDKHPEFKGQLRNGAFFRCDDIEFFLMKYNKSSEIMLQLNNLCKERLLPNVETILIEPTFALLISAEENRSGHADRPFHEIKIVGFGREGDGRATLCEESTALPPK